MRCVINEGYFLLYNGNRFEVYVFEFDDLFRGGFTIISDNGFDFYLEKKSWQSNLHFVKQRTFYGTFTC